MPPIPFDYSEKSYASLPERFYKHTNPAYVPDPKIIRTNTELAQELGIDAEWLNSDEGLAILSGNDIEKGSRPLAQAYAGHQFGGFNPQLGDGRAVLLGEVIAQSGTRYDIQLKGSGRTPFSRGGDGKSALGPALREYILCESMHALGVKTTRALGVVSTGEKVMRHDGSQPGAVFTRIATSHIRVGTFQYFAAQRDLDAVRELADFAIARHYPECLSNSNHNQSDSDTTPTHPPYLHFLKATITAQAELIAHWMSLGFIHGVMNTDNCSISGETIDYGPCAFMDVFHPKAVFSSIDRDSRYAWGNQPSIGIWNMSRFAECLQPLLHDDEATAHALTESALHDYSEQFRSAYSRRFRAKLCLPSSAPEEIIQESLTLIANQQVDFTLFFRRLTLVAAGEHPNQLKALFPDEAAFDHWFALWEPLSEPENLLAEMRAANPIVIPRNHRVEEAIQSAYRGNFTPFHRLHEALKQPYTEDLSRSDLETPPSPEEIVRETFCGT